MAANPTVHHAGISPRNGILTLSGYGICARVDRGHLTLEDGVGRSRRRGRLARVRNGLRRLVVIGSDGMLSLAALRWLAAQGAAFVMLDRDGSVVLSTGPVRASDVRLRRAQAFAFQSGAALQISRELIEQKLAGQERNARDVLMDSAAADAIAEQRTALPHAKSTDQVRLIEAKGAGAYWAAWRAVEIEFPRLDAARVPDHWRAFDSRLSPVTGSARLAANPANAMLNYLYAILQAEARLAAAALGLDPGMGVLHSDTKNRDSLACDIMEPIRPRVDAYVLSWLKSQPLKREWFFEQPDGNCRLTDSLARMLAETAPNWARAVAPVAESVCRMLWASAKVPRSEPKPAARLTQQYRREAKGANPLPPTKPMGKPVRLCKLCGADLQSPKSKYCLSCAEVIVKRRFAEVARLGRELARAPIVNARRSKSQREQRLKARHWNQDSLPKWLNLEIHRERVQPQLASIPYRQIAAALKVSEPYAAAIRNGKYLPHRRHWMALATLADIAEIAIKE